jgi:hypothetical protein
MEFYDVIKAVYDNIFQELDMENRFDPNMLIGGGNQHNYNIRRSLIESIEGGTHVFVSAGTLTQTQNPVQFGPGLPPIIQTTIQDHRTFEGWTFEPRP